MLAPGDIESLAAAMRRLLEDPALRERLGSAARATIETHFSLSDAMDRLSAIYARFGLEAHACATGELD
jgi:glycosyltransferase involved in cell wall biosynthesis